MLLIRLMGQLPLKVNRQIGASLGKMAALFGKRTKQLSLSNIQRCLGHLTKQQQRQLAKSSMVETVKTAVETASIWSQSYQRLEDYICGSRNLDQLKDHYQTNKGVLLLAPHLGNWEMLGSYVAQHFSNNTVIFQPADSQAMDELMQKSRNGNGIKLAPANRQGVAQVLKALKAGEMVTILPDQVPNTGAGEWSQFFNQPALTMTLVHKLIQKTNCEVMMGVAWRTSKGFEVEFIEPDLKIKDDDPVISLLALNHSIEKCVVKHPEQYQWEYNRFKRKRRRIKG